LKGGSVRGVSKKRAGGGVRDEKVSDWAKRKKGKSRMAKREEWEGAVRDDG